MGKKSFYIFLTSLLGLLLFLTFHRVIFFFYFYLAAAGYVNIGLTFFELFFLEYLSLLVFLALGLWYGIWLGLGWYARIYEEKTHFGVVHHIATRIFGNGRDVKLEAKLAAAKARLESDVAKVEELAEAMVEQVALAPKKKKAVGKRVVKKI